MITLPRYLPQDARLSRTVHFLFNRYVTILFSSEYKFESPSPRNFLVITKIFFDYRILLSEFTGKDVSKRFRSAINLRIVFNNRFSQFFSYTDPIKISFLISFSYFSHSTTRRIFIKLHS